MARKKKVVEMSSSDIIREYRRIVDSRHEVRRDSIFDEFGNYRKISFLKEADIHYLMNSCDLVEA